MTWGFVALAGGTIYSANKQSEAAENAANITAQSTNRAIDLQREQYRQDVARQKPFYDVGVNALPELVEASRYKNFGMDQFQADPGYAFRLSEGQKALERSAAARGGLLSGGTGKALQRFGQEMGSQEYTNAFNRYQLERQAKLNPLQSLTGTAQTAANTLGAAGQNMANNVGAAYMNQGVNQGNALMAATQARTSAYGDIAKLYGQTNPNFSGLFGGGGGGGGAAAYNISPEQYSGYFG